MNHQPTNQPMSPPRELSPLSSQGQTYKDDRNMNITPSNLGGDPSREMVSALSGPADEQKGRDQSGYGVPADMTPSSNKTADAEPFVDEEEEEVETNNIVT